MLQELLTGAIRPVIVSIVGGGKDIVVSIDTNPAIIEAFSAMEKISRPDVPVAVGAKVEDDRILGIRLSHLPYGWDGGRVEDALRHCGRPKGFCVIGYGFPSLHQLPSLTVSI